MKKENQYERLVSELRGLKLERDKADARLMLRLVEVEENPDELSIALSFGAESFEQFLKSNPGLVDPAKYVSFKLGLARVGRETALAIGSEATIVAARLTNGPDTYVKAVTAWSAEYGGALPSRQAAHHLLHQVDPRVELPEPVRRQNEIAKLRAQVEELRAKLRAAENEIRELKKKLNPKRPQPTI